MLGRRDRPSNTLLLADGPVLLKGPGPLYRGLVDPGTREYLVRALVEREVPVGRPRFVGGQVGVGFDDVVLDERVPRPAVDGEVSGASGIVCSTISDCPLSLRTVSELEASRT